MASTRCTASVGVACKRSSRTAWSPRFEELMTSPWQILRACPAIGSGHQSVSPCQPKGCRLCRLAAIESPHGNRLPSAGLHCVTRMPSNRNSPLSVPIQRYPSLVCVIALTAPPGNLLSVFQYSRTYWSRERFGSSPYARLTRHISAIPFSAQRPCLNREIREDTRTFRSRLRFPSSTAFGPYQTHTMYI